MIWDVPDVTVKYHTRWRRVKPRLAIKLILISWRTSPIKLSLTQPRKQFQSSPVPPGIIEAQENFRRQRATGSGDFIQRTEQKIRRRTGSYNLNIRILQQIVLITDAFIQRILRKTLPCFYRQCGNLSSTISFPTGIEQLQSNTFIKLQC